MSRPTIEKIRPGVEFTPQAAASFRRAEAEWGREIDVNSTYRDWDYQLSMYNAWNAYVNGTGPYPGHSRAIHPDQSRHTSGLALDSDDWTSPAFRSMMERHGWIRTAAWDPTEQHHFEYQSWNDQHINDPEPEEDMTPEERKMLKEIHHRVHKGLTGERIAGAVWAQNGIGAFIKRMGNRVLANYDSMRDGKKGVRTTGSGLADLKSRMGRVELQNEALLAVVKDLADSKGVDGEAIVQQVAKSVDKALADVSITLTNEEE